VAAAEFGVGGDGQVPLGAGGLLPVSAVGHHRGEHVLTLLVGLLQGLVAGGQLLFLARPVSTATWSPDAGSWF